MMRFVRAFLGICAICVLAAVLPDAALASSEPSAFTYSPVTATGLTTATVDGDVNPAGQTTTYEVEYALASSEWCTSFGSSGSLSSTTAQTLSFTDTDFHEVSVDLTGLTAGMDYCVDLVASNGSSSGDGGQISFAAGTPSAFTYSPVTATGLTTATVDGNVNPAGQTTTYEVEYALASSDWCTSYGSSGSASSTTAQTLSSTDTDFHDVSVGLTGLTAGMGYCADLVASNGSSSGDGGQISFAAGTPSAFTYSPVTATGLTTATVDGNVNPAGQTTTYEVEYALASSDWCTTFTSSGSPSSTTAQMLSSTDTDFHDVSVDLTGLTAGTGYCADLVASNASGNGDGGQVWFTAGAPSAYTDSLTATGVTTAMVEGRVNPAGQTTTYKVEYALASSMWCTSYGSSGSPTSSTTAQTLSSTDATFHDVSVGLTGLTAGTSYCADLVASNGSGSGDGGQLSFTAGVPITITSDATATGATTATVDGDVNPAGQTTTYEVEYALASSEWCTSYGSSGSPASSTTAQTLGFTDATFHDVSVGLTGLTAGTGYCADLVASNGSGSWPDGGQIPFTTVEVHSLTVSRGGAGKGTVTSSPAGIACGSTCAHVFNHGTNVTLNAVPAAGSRFGGWSGGGCSGSGSCVLTLNADTTVTATFNLIPVQTRITKAKINSGKRMATFKFVGSGGVKPYKYQCKLDKKKYSSCSSGKVYKHLKPGKHTFWVRAKDHAGRVDKTPAIKKFKIKH